MRTEPALRKDRRPTNVPERAAAGLCLLLLAALWALGTAHADPHAMSEGPDARPGHLLLAQDSSRGMVVVEEDPAGSATLGDYHALLIGIDEYQEWPRLDFAQQDAADIRNILVDRYGFSTDKITHLKGSDATRSRILRELRDLLETLDENDNLLVFYAGHGQLDPLTGEGYWIPVDGALTYEETWIAFPNLRTMLTAPGVRAKNVVLVTDSCYGGAVASRSGLTPGLLEAAQEDYEKYRQKLIDNSELRSRQVLASGGFEEVPDRSEFARLLKEALRQNPHPMVDFEYLFYTGIAPYLVPGGQQRPLLARLIRGAEHDGQFVLLQDAGAPPPPPPPPQQATLTVRSNVLNDQVYVNGVARGSTRLDLELAPGSYLVRVEKADHAPFEQRIELAAGESRVLRAQLERKSTRRPRILSFDGQPQVIRAGQSATLEWRVVDAETVEITGLGSLPLSGSRLVSPSATTTYVLTARGGDGAQVQAELPVRVETVEPRIVSFAANPTRIRKGQSVRVDWATEHAARVEISGIGSVPLNGSRTLYPEGSRRYQLVAVNEDGARVERMIRVMVETPSREPAVSVSTRLTIDQTWTADLDNGRVGGRSGVDIWFQAKTATQRYITPRGGARLARVGRQAPGYGDCKKASLGSASVPVSASTSGDYFCVRTNEGRYARFKITEPVGKSPGKLVIALTTWEGANSSVTLSAPRQISPGNGKSFDVYPRTTELRWARVGGAASYTVEIDCLHCCQSGRWCSDVSKPWKLAADLSSTRYRFNFVGAQPGRWRVWAVDRQGNAGRKSSWWEFKYTR